MVQKTFIIVATLIGAVSAQAQQPTAETTPWHVSTIFTFTMSNQDRRLQAGRTLRWFLTATTP